MHNKLRGVHRNIAAVALTWIRVGTYHNIHTSLDTFILDVHPEHSDLTKRVRNRPKYPDDYHLVKIYHQ